MLLVSILAGGAVGEGSLDESRILYGFRLPLNFISVTKRYKFLLVLTP
jgi:hypothetical protein